MGGQTEGTPTSQEKTVIFSQFSAFFLVGVEMHKSQAMRLWGPASENLELHETGSMKSPFSVFPLSWSV